MMCFSVTKSHLRTVVKLKGFSFLLPVGVFGRERTGTVSFESVSKVVTPREVWAAGRDARRRGAGGREAGAITAYTGLWQNKQTTVCSHLHTVFSRAATRPVHTDRNIPSELQHSTSLLYCTARRDSKRSQQNYNHFLLGKNLHSVIFFANPK